MHHRIIPGIAMGLAAIVLASLLTACGPIGVGQAPVYTPIPTLIPVAQATNTPEPLPTPRLSGQSLGPARSPASNTVLSSFTTEDFSGPGVCAACHLGLKDQSGADVSMPTAWRSTMMANAARDPIWQAKVSSEVARFPALQAVIEKKCVTCHMPMAETEATTGGLPVAAQGDGFFNANNPLHEAAIDGVSCTLCHQISAKNLGETASFSGGYTIDTSTNPPDRVIYGPYQQPITQTMQASTGYIPEYGAHMVTAEHCATCHNLYTPYVDADGNILGEFPEQTPYTEWEHSSFGNETTSCQSCHMPLAQGGVVISNVPANLAPREPFYQHYFVGGNAFMLQILADWGGQMGVTADSAQFAVTQARVTDQLNNRSATLSLDGMELKDGRLNATLHVSPLTGHKFPTSFPSRRAWLHVTVSDATGNVIFESGKPSGDGAIAGNAADTDPAAFEPHYDVITQPDEVQIYEPIMGDNEGHVTYTLLRAANYLKDNRLLPAGADKTSLPADIAVYGAAKDDASFLGGGDSVTYQVDVTGATGPFTLDAELLYEPLSYQFVQDLLKDNTVLVQRFAGYYGETDKTPMRVAAIDPVQTQ